MINASVLKKWIIIIPFAFAGVSFLKKRNRVEINLGLASIKTCNVTVWARPKRLEQIWQLHHKNWPVYVLESTKHWVKITDAYNTSGWIEKKYIGAPYALILENMLAVDATLLKKFNLENSATNWPTKDEIKEKQLEKHALLLQKNCCIKIAQHQKYMHLLTFELSTNFEKKQYYILRKKVWTQPNFK